MKYLLIFIFFYTSALSKESICYGTTSHGKLKHGIQLPSEGENFVSYSTLAKTLNRTYVHSKVKTIIVETYEDLAKQIPTKIYKYGETGFKEGGRFRPHKTHQNGLSVDFMVPVLNQDGKSVHLPTNLLNKFGYLIEFDKNGKFDKYKIDFEALAAHIVTLHKVAKKHNAGLWRVIFDPNLQHYLLKTKHGKYIKNNIQLSKKKSWVRHDEHYHVDFIVKCKKLSEFKN